MAKCSFCKTDHPTPRSGVTGEQLFGPCIEVLAKRFEDLHAFCRDLGKLPGAFASLERSVGLLEQRVDDIELKLDLKEKLSGAPPPAIAQGSERSSEDHVAAAAPSAGAPGDTAPAEPSSK